MDTGTSLITGPSEIIHKILRSLNVNNCDDFSNLPNLTFNLVNQDITLTPDEYMMKA